MASSNKVGMALHLNFTNIDFIVIREKLFSYSLRPYGASDTDTSFYMGQLLLFCCQEAIDSIGSCITRSLFTYSSA
jgi:hypothetical protein